MSDVALPKEQQTAYQRWELNSFDVPEKERDVDAMVLSRDLHLERIQQQAHEEGYANGYREGSDQAATVATQLQRIVAALSEEVQQFDQRVADDLLGLALAISKQVLRQTLKLRPEVILQVVKEVLGKLPLTHQRARLVLHPQDAVMVRQSLGERLTQSNWEIIESSDMTRGGCRLEAAECEIDATLECRWQRVIDALGSDHGWID